MFPPVANHPHLPRRQTRLRTLISRGVIGGLVVALAVVAVVAFGAGVSSPCQAASEPLLWPTNAGTCLTSNFGEWREGHFHSGIDFSTQGTTGFECYAVADADVVRLRVSCRGYGRTVYLRMKDGRFAVYAHLERFEGALADTARAIQERKGTALFDAEFPPGAIPVKRGQLIARTGQSGAGPPHLHFEIRDSSERPLNPLAHGIRAPDAKAPRIKRFAITPLSAEASVEGDSKTVVLGVSREKNGKLFAERVVRVTGRVGIAVESHDGIDACDRGMAPKRWELHEGETALFAVDCDRFSFDEWGLVDLQFDPRYSFRSAGDFVNLWRRPGNDFPSSAGEWTGAEGLEAPPGTQRTFEVRTVDAAGNVARATILLKFEDQASIPAEKKVGGAWARALLEGGRLLRANTELHFVSADSLTTVRIPARVLREDAVGSLVSQTVTHHARELVPVGAFHRLELGAAPLAGEYEISAKIPADFSGDRDRVGLYVQVGDRFRFLSSFKTRGECVGKTQRPRPFGLFEDQGLPTVGDLALRTVRDRVRVLTTVRDRGAGVDCSGIQLFAGDRELLHEYDEETGEVFAELPLELANANGIAVRVRAEDRVGNCSEKSETLTPGESSTRTKSTKPTKRGSASGHRKGSKRH